MLQQIRANVHETNGKRNKDRQFQQRFKRYKEESEESDMTWRLKKKQISVADCRWLRRETIKSYNVREGKRKKGLKMKSATKHIIMKLLKC